VVQKTEVVLIYFGVIMISKFLSQTYYKNTVLEYITVLVMLIVGFTIIKLIKYYTKKYFMKLDAKEDKNINFKLENVNKYIVPFLYLGVIYLSVESLTIPKSIDKILQTVLIIITTWFLIRFASQALKYFLTGYIENADKESDRKKIKALTSLFNVIVYVVGFLFLLDNLGINITAIATGLGIGGIAVALAAQALLGDLFSYFVIFFDRPFEIGDFISLETKSGTIEQIGIKSTKIRSLSGELIVVSNSSLTNSKIHNYKALKRRRVVFSLGIKYDTKIEQLKAIPEIISTIIARHDKIELDRCTFASYGDFSLNYEIVVFFDSPDYKEYMQTQHEINLEIFEEFGKQNIEFAFPTHTIHVEK